MNNFYVYVYFEPGTCIPIYVGKGQGARAWDHLKFSNHSGNSRGRNLPWANKVAKLIREGYNPQPELIHENLSCEAEADFIEMQMIAQYGRRCNGTGTLYNLTEGGEGATGHKFVPTEETRRKMSIAHMGNKNGLGYRHTPEALKKISEASKGGKGSRGWKHPNRKPVACLYGENGPIKQVYDCIYDVRKDGLSHSSVQNCLRNNSKRANGYFWKYLEDINEETQKSTLVECLC